MPAPGTLFVVATPIGNLEDITLRALRVLREVSVVAAEDTRRTANLLRHYTIGTPLLSLHAHNEHRRVPQLIERLERGESIALVTDAGTPGISDPGALVVAGVRARGLRVEPVPGASSVAAALSVAGLPAGRFAFLGFVPIRSNDRLKYFTTIAELGDFVVVLFEAPHRIERTLTELSRILVKRPITVARELTKAHEEVVSGKAEAIFALLSSPRGEFTIVVSPAEAADRPIKTWSAEETVTLFGDLTKHLREGRRAVLREVAKRTGQSANHVFEILENAKKIGRTTD